jgi:hypothetical protein
VNANIKKKYRFTEINELQKLPLDDKIAISVEVIGEALSLCRHTPALFDYRPCVFDEYGELVDLSGTGLDGEYDAEILMDKHGQLKFI